MRRILLGILVAILILGALGAVGFAGYQYGYRQGALASSSGNQQLPPGHPDIGPGGMFRNGPGFHHGFGGGFGMMHGGMGFGFLSPLFFLLRLAFWALVLWALYMLIARSGWRLTRDTTVTPVNPVPPAETYTKVETTETKTE